jgi:AcrR family transcriptional regulator
LRKLIRASVRRGPYQLKQRAQSAAHTRQRCIEAARRVIAERGLHRLTLAEVARAAGVSRPTVYQQFGSKLSLIDAVTRDLDRRGGYEQLIAALTIADPIESLRASMRAGYGVYATDPELFRQLYGVAAGDPEVAQLMAMREVGRRNFVSQLVARLASARRLRPGITHADATAILLALTHFCTFDQFQAVADARPAADIAIAILTQTLLHELPRNSH